MMGNVLWHIGNTTVRTPYRLRDALLALNGTNLPGNLIGVENEDAFAKRLHDFGVLTTNRIERGESAPDLGRKWRVALAQLGFLTPKLGNQIEDTGIDRQLKELSDVNANNYTGRPFEITENGFRLMNAERLVAQQQCFLRSLLAYKIPSILEPRYTKYCSRTFSPLLMILQICVKLGELEGSTKLSLNEFALFVQVATPDIGIEIVVEQIVDYRKNMHKTTGASSTSTYRERLELVTEIGNVQQSTVFDYADLNIRYIKATGLFIASGRGGIELNPQHRRSVDFLIERGEVVLESYRYLPELWHGSSIPTDSPSLRQSVIRDLLEQLEEYGVEVPLALETNDSEYMQNLLFESEERLLQAVEHAYASKQANLINEIETWMDTIASGRMKSLPNGEVFKVPSKPERPAYLEWIVWRAILSINSFSTPPWEARRFRIDQDFLPVNCAPGGGPDMMFEFKEFMLVVEVTLSSSSRQEATEGESVRRHVATVANTTTKGVIGLFVAVVVDNNTAHAFKAGEWYHPDATRRYLQIVPMSLEDFRLLIITIHERNDDPEQVLRSILIECRSHSNEDAPTWLKSISRVIQRYRAEVSTHANPVPIL